jgi:hypothetical protein
LRLHFHAQAKAVLKSKRRGETEEAEANTVVEAVEQPGIEVVEMASHPAAVARAIMCLSVGIRS